ncbi:glycosyltransferase [Thermococcus peptonophilus]|uniref:glycosyltransferase n=1 Tax=Thermococcus peptonophilus TaxID=53952 RepID=UPI003467EAAA
MIVDDNSNDRTGEIAEDLAREHGWIKVIHLKDRAVGYDLRYRYSDVVRRGLRSGYQLRDREENPPLRLHRGGSRR